MAKFEWTQSVKTLRRPYRASQLHLHGLPKALERIRQAANRDSKMRFTSLWHHVYNIEALATAYYSLKRDVAPGVDGETWRVYGLELEDNLRDLSDRLKRGAYRAKPVKRTYIPKSDGRQRPLGVTTCPLNRTLVNGEHQLITGVSIINRTGQKIPVNISTAALRDTAGKTIGGVETFRDLSELEELRRQANRSFTHEDIVGRNPRIRQILALLPDIAESDSPVLIYGPTGSGKELFARAIHTLSSRKDGPFIPVNCATLSDTLLESELFGYAKGAFTGAVRNKPGRFLLANEGTLLLDEICNTSVAFQADLLRVLEDGEFTPLGDIKPLRTNFRVVAATNRNLKELVREGKFRKDLYYRLNVAKICLPRLKERKEDISLLVEHFIHKFNILKDKTIRGITPQALAYLLDYPFPGNIRELENIIEYAFIPCKDRWIDLEHLPGDMDDVSGKPDVGSAHTAGLYTNTEALKIHALLQQYHGNRQQTAQAMGISRTTLWRKIKKHGLSG